MIETLSAQALDLLKSGQLDAADQLFRKILAYRPDHPDSLNLLGVIAARRGGLKEALTAIDRASCCDGRQARFHHNLGNVRRLAGDITQAAAACYDALRIDDEMIGPRQMLANMAHLAGDGLAAIGHYRTILAIAPETPLIFYNLGIALEEMRQPGDAIVAYRRALAMNIRHGDARFNLARLLRQSEQWDEAHLCLQTVLAFNPADFGAWAELLMARLMLCDWRTASRDHGRLLDLVRNDSADLSPFILLLVAATAEDQLLCARRWVESHAKSIGSENAPRAPANPSRGISQDKIRIGYLSSDYFDHATSYLLVEMLERHDRSRFEVIAFSLTSDDGSPIRNRLQRAVGQMVDLSGFSAAAAAEIIRGRGIQILVDLKGHTGGACPQILATRPAPLQVNFLGYPGTSGADFIDYMIADRLVLPEYLRPFFSEKIVYLPGCYQPNDSRRPIADTALGRIDYGLPEKGFVFCCFNNSYKITPRLFDIWMRLLTEVPGSVLWLLRTHPSTAENLCREALSRGVMTSRLIFAPRLPLAEHLARHRVADLFLDTLPCNAHTTASDSLWAGLPLLTCTGNTFAGRVAASLLHAVGLPELVTDSLDDYEQRALLLARQPDALLMLRDRLAINRSKTPLFDGDLFARRIETAYARMWERWRKGEPAALIDLAGASV